MPVKDLNVNFNTKLSMSALLASRQAINSGDYTVFKKKDSDQVTRKLLSQFNTASSPGHSSLLGSSNSSGR